jgi:hypothetical protein
MEEDRLRMLLLYRMAQRRPGHVCWSHRHRGESYGSDRTSTPSMATLGLTPPPRDITAFKTSANKGREVT